MNAPNNHPDLIAPPPVRRGDTVGILAPAGPILKEADFTAGVRLLREAGIEVKFSREIFRRQGYLAGPDKERAQEFHRLWADPEVKAILAARGGYGSLRLLPLLDLPLLRQQPKIFVGFSDITALHAAIFKETGLLTFHGPMVTTLPHTERASTAAFFDLLAGRLPESLKFPQMEILRPGSARGRLLGGNLASLVHLVGTPYESSWQGAILFLEDICEAPYRIDRMLTHLHLAGRLDGIAGLILGSFEGCGDQEVIWKRALELLEGRDLPVWANYPAGHSRHNQILPLGQEVEMSSATGRLTFRGPLTALP